VHSGTTTQALTLPYKNPQGASDEAVAEAVAPKPEDPEPLTEEEQAEKERLLSEGFNNWTRKCVRACMCACVRAFVHARVHVCVRACACARVRERRGAAARVCTCRPRWSRHAPCSTPTGTLCTAPVAPFKVHFVHSFKVHFVHSARCAQRPLCTALRCTLCTAPVAPCWGFLHEHLRGGAGPAHGSVGAGAAHPHTPTCMCAPPSFTAFVRTSTCSAWGVGAGAAAGAVHPHTPTCMCAPPSFTAFVRISTCSAWGVGAGAVHPHTPTRMCAPPGCAQGLQRVCAHLREARAREHSADRG